jgi:diketogulonate reductase-like aldo/keto reductase
MASRRVRHVSRIGGIDARAYPIDRRRPGALLPVRVRLLGVSNVTLDQLQLLCRQARFRPHFVQNRCYAARGWDRDIREFCAASGLVYQGFSLLSANGEALAGPERARIAARHGRTVAQVVFRFALEVGMVPLTGTTDTAHMRADLDVFDFRLEPDDVQQIERLAAR